MVSERQKTILKVQDGIPSATPDNSAIEHLVRPKLLPQTDESQASMLTVQNKVSDVIKELHEMAAVVDTSLLPITHGIGEYPSSRVQRVPEGFNMLSTKDDVLTFEEIMNSQYGTSKTFEKWLHDSTKYQSQDVESKRQIKRDIVHLETVTKKSRDEFIDCLQEQAHGLILEV